MKNVKTTKTTESAVSIGDVISAFETVVSATSSLGATAMGQLLTDQLYASHDEAYIEALVLAGERAKAIQQDAWLKANESEILILEAKLKNEV